MQQFSAQLANNSWQEVFKQLRKSFTALTTIDFLPNDSQLQTRQALQAREVHINHQLSPNEPEFTIGDIA